MTRCSGRAGPWDFRTGSLAGGGLEALRRDTDAFLAVELPEGEGAAQPTLRAVGSEDDLERIQSELRGFE